jgi:hypothetical protein
MAAFAVWDRQAGESAKAFALFGHYRDMGPLERSLSRVAREFGRPTATVEWLARKHNWVPRATAWDTENERIKRSSQIKAVESLARRQVLAGQLMMAKGLKRLQAMSDEEVALLSLWETIRLIEGGARLERIGVGQPDEAAAVTFQQVSVNVGESTLAEILRRNPTRVGPIVAALDLLRQTVPELGSGGPAVYYEEVEIEPDLEEAEDDEPTE